MQSQSSVSSLACECLFSVYPEEMRSPVLSPEEQLEVSALRDLLKGIGGLSVVLNLPTSHAGLADVLGGVGYHLIIAESSPAMTRILFEQLQDLGLAESTEQAEEVDLPSGSADLVFCHQLLDAAKNSTSREAIMRELARISGRYVVVSCSECSAQQRWQSFARQLLGGRPPEPASPAEIIALAERFGLELRGRTAIGTRPETGEFLLFEQAAFRDIA